MFQLIFELKVLMINIFPLLLLMNLLMHEIVLIFLIEF